MYPNLKDIALKVYSNAHKLVAMANLYNITISVFSYGGPKDEWTQIPPDPVMVADAVAKLGKYFPDVALYHSHNTHYDLLVKRDSKMALVDSVAVCASVNVDPKLNTKAPVDEWTTVKGKKSTKSGAKISDKEEKLIRENDAQETNSKDIEEELTLA